jgi:hypothetical protein
MHQDDSQQHAALLQLYCRVVSTAGVTQLPPAAAVGFMMLHGGEHTL